MVVYQRQTVVDAPFDRVWAFHAGIDGLTAVTPNWMGLEVDRVVAPAGGSADDLGVGSRLELSLSPFGFVPAGSWTALITDRAVGTDAAWFRDEMVEGPFDRWIHTHRFTAVDGGTRITDRVDYELPAVGALGLSGIAHPFFELVFRDRHRRTKAQLED
ncbi:SRPBCC family protein [Halovivax gelatinilyticus]|uniref:SRPBCC family protein n=1 Tax=Halovivax gelatinilyticus TaxID=2961597 RepID=UPI0020CA99D1|nr:SRPBCC family protein [Halovivax gelatinilyticus]